MSIACYHTGHKSRQLSYHAQRASYGRIQGKIYRRYSPLHLPADRLEGEAGGAYVVRMWKACNAFTDPAALVAGHACDTVLAIATTLGTGFNGQIRERLECRHKSVEVIYSPKDELGVVRVAGINDDMFTRHFTSPDRNQVKRRVVGQKLVIGVYVPRRWRMLHFITHISSQFRLGGSLVVKSLRMPWRPLSGSTNGGFEGFMGWLFGASVYLAVSDLSESYRTCCPVVFHQTNAWDSRRPDYRNGGKRIP